MRRFAVAERGERQPVQRAAAADCAYGRLVVEIKRLRRESARGSVGDTAP